VLGTEWGGAVAAVSASTDPMCIDFVEYYKQSGARQGAGERWTRERVYRVD